MLKWNPPVAVVWFFEIPFFHPKILAKIYFSASFGEVLSPFKARKTKGRSSFGGNVFFLKKIYFPFNFEGFLWKQSRIFCVHQHYLMGKNIPCFQSQAPQSHHLQTPLQPCNAPPTHGASKSPRRTLGGKKGEKMEGKQNISPPIKPDPKSVGDP